MEQNQYRYSFICWSKLPTYSRLLEDYKFPEIAPIKKTTCTLCHWNFKIDIIDDPEWRDNDNDNSIRGNVNPVADQERSLKYNENESLKKGIVY